MGLDGGDGAVRPGLELGLAPAHVRRGVQPPVVRRRATRGEDGTQIAIEWLVSRYAPARGLARP